MSGKTGPMAGEGFVGVVWGMYSEVSEDGMEV